MTPGILKKAYFGAASLAQGVKLAVRDDLFCQPAKDFEQVTGMTGLSRDWDMPDNKSPSDVQSYLSDLWNKRHDLAHQPYFDLREVDTIEAALYDAYHQLIDRNPDLKTIPFVSQDINKVMDVVYGATSGYNLDDIAHYVHRAHEDAVKDRARSDRIFAQLWVRAGWVMSPATAQKIENHFGIGAADIAIETLL